VLVTQHPGDTCSVISSRTSIIKKCRPSSISEYTAAIFRNKGVVLDHDKGRRRGKKSYHRFDIRWLGAFETARWYP